MNPYFFWLKVLVAISAFWGAGIGTLNMIRDFIKDQRRLKVELWERAQMTFMPGMDDTFDEFIIQYDAANPGYRSVTINAMGLVIREGLRIREFQTMTREQMQQLPYEIEPGKNYQASIGREKLLETLEEYDFGEKVVIRAWFSDVIGDRYYSDVRTLDVEEDLLERKGTWFKSGHVLLMWIRKLGKKVGLVEEEKIWED